ncbi:MAG: NADH:ubiquinone oxidoreductase [Acidimicrobiales bacterium]
MAWIPRGIREGIVTSCYPREADGYGPEFRGSIEVSESSATTSDLVDALRVCPTGAISLRDGKVALDRGACILCGRCTQVLPAVFQFSPNFEISTRQRSDQVVPVMEESETAIFAVQSELAARVKSLRRSVHIRHVDAGSDGSEEWEIAALTNPVYDVQRLGIYFTASPRHADVLLVSGAGAVGMIGPLQHTYDVMPHPKVVIAAGVDAVSGGLLQSSYATRAGISSSVPVDVFVPGSPPTPFGLLHGILMAVNLLAPLRTNAVVKHTDRSVNSPRSGDS